MKKYGIGCIVWSHTKVHENRQNENLDPFSFFAIFLLNYVLSCSAYACLFRIYLSMQIEEKKSYGPVSGAQILTKKT